MKEKEGIGGLIPRPVHSFSSPLSPPFPLCLPSVCSIPPEFCEYNPPDLYADCLRWRAKHHPELLPEVCDREWCFAGKG